ncbi:hypothetical protein BC628DRAFT_1335182 [Trametes gibbosa]|nr:hypothetical protein BC628DRAFT_1335182 [Trametes gibbosa]
MAAYITTITPSKFAPTLAGPACTAKHSRSIISIAPSPSLLPSPSLVSFSSHRPNKVELEARLAGAQIRAKNRRLAAALGHGRAPTTTTPVRPRTARAVGSSYESVDAPSTPSSYTSSPLSQVSYPTTGMFFTIPNAPSPSMLPPPPTASSSSTTTTTTPPPLFPRRRSRMSVRGMYSALGFAHSLELDVDADAPLTPHHVYPDALRRTPGAPVWADGASYFHLPADIITPQLPAGGQATVGLGIMNIDL